MAIAGWYSWVAHAVLLVITLVFILYSIRLVVRLRRMEGEYSKWNAIGTSGTKRPDGGEEAGG